MDQRRLAPFMLGPVEQHRAEALCQQQGQSDGEQHLALGAHWGRRADDGGAIGREALADRGGLGGARFGYLRPGLGDFL